MRRCPPLDDLSSLTTGADATGISTRRQASELIPLPIPLGILRSMQQQTQIRVI